MKRFFISTLSVLALSTVATPAIANEVVAVNRDTASQINEISPFNLVSGSYQGRFKAQGIPSNGALKLAILTNRIEAEDLVRGAIAEGRLTEETLNDRQYLHSVNALLENLNSD